MTQGLPQRLRAKRYLFGDTRSDTRSADVYRPFNNAPRIELPPDTSCSSCGQPARTETITIVRPGGVLEYRNVIRKIHCTGNCRAALS
jgi:hypothetical protein